MLLSFVVSSMGFATGTVWDTTTHSTPFEHQEPLENSSLNVDAALRWESLQYFVGLPETSYLNRSQFFSASFQVSHETERVASRLNLSAGSFLAFDENTFTISEAFVATGNGSEPYRFSFGRRRENWSSLDEHWELGVYQPIYNFDVLRPEVQGLTGFFLEWQGTNVRLMARLSPIFIPNQGAPIQNKDGKLMAPSRFFKAPATSTVLIGQPTQIQYDLNIPKLDQLIARPGYSLFAGWRDVTRDGPWLQSSYSYKPNPYLPVSFLGYLSLPEGQNQSPEGEVMVAPYASYHHLWAADVGWTQGGYRAGMSFLAEQPGEGFYEDTWTRQVLTGFQAASLNLSFPLWAALGRRAQASIGYLHVNGGESAIAGPNYTGADASLFEDRLSFRRAWQMQVSGPLLAVFGRALSTRSRWLYDTEQRGLLLSTELQFEYSPSLSFLTGADIIGIPGGRDDDDSGYFLNQYRANDRFFGGVSYVF